MDQAKVQGPPVPKFVLSVKRLINGVWTEGEYKKIGTDQDGKEIYGTIDVTRLRSNEREVFRFETDHEPDALEMTKLLTQRGAKVYQYDPQQNQSRDHSAGVARS